MPDYFLLAYASFNADNQPFIDCQIDGEIKRRELFGQDLSLEFDFSTKYCTGWVDFDNHSSQVCPDSATVDGKYENCLKAVIGLVLILRFITPIPCRRSRKRLIKTRTSSIWHISRRE